ncbi:MAG: TIM barrel protein [Caldilineaceae bacterium]|nr:TIM barrel protein [Caldilineaceae bacterium]
MQYSTLPVSLYADFAAGRRTLGEWFRLAADLGLDGADISVAHLKNLSAPYLDQLRSEATDAGVQIAMIATYSDFTHPQAAERARQIEEVHEYIDAAARMGASFVRVTAGQRHPGVEQAAGIAWAVEGLTSCLDHAAEVGVTLTYENHTKGSVWQYYDFSQPASIFLEIMRHTAGSGLRLLYDTANTLGSGDDPLAVLAEVRERIDVIHVNDIRRAGHFEPCLVGTGVAPIEAIFRVLAQSNFAGWISVEEASNQGEAGFRQAIPYVKALWARIQNEASAA